MKNFTYYYVSGQSLPSFEYSRYVNDPNIIADDLLIQITPPLFVDGKETQYDIERSFDFYRSMCGIDLPIAFNELRKLSPMIARSFIAFVGESSNRFDNTHGYVHKHFHPPARNLEFKYIANTRRTTTVVVPTKLRNEVSEVLCVQRYDFEFKGKDYVPYSYQREDWFERFPKVGEVERIRMPNEGEYLVLDFESSHLVHWIENSLDSKNEFICLVNDL